MRGLALALIGATGALMIDQEDKRAQQLGALFIYGSVFGLPDLKDGV